MTKQAGSPRGRLDAVPPCVRCGRLALAEGARVLGLLPPPKPHPLAGLQEQKLRGRGGGRSGGRGLRILLCARETEGIGEGCEGEEEEIGEAEELQDAPGRWVRWRRPACARAVGVMAAAGRRLGWGAVAAAGGPWAVAWWAPPA